MSKTKLSIDGEKFKINGTLTYAEIENCPPKSHGLLMNSRMIQGIFDSPNKAQFQRYSKEFCAERNTDELIDALPAWYAKGLRAITVGMQGGGSCYTIDSATLRNTPYSADDTQLDAAYLARLDRLIVINEDSQAIKQLKVCDELSVSWGCYNNMTKQEPPTYWEITEGEDTFFAWRMADMLGIAQEPIASEDQYYLQGFEPHMHYKDKRFPRVASLYPETIDFVRFYCNDALQGVCYDECFTLNFCSNWQQLGVIMHDSDVWKAEITLRSGEVITRTAVENNL